MSKWRDFIVWATVKPRQAKLCLQFPEAEIYPNGSRYVCDPPVLTTDIDFLVYTKDNIHNRLITLGYRHTSREDSYFQHSNAKEPINCYRKGKINLVVTDCPDFTQKHRIATHICLTQNFKHKFDRIVVYEGVRGNTEYLGGLIDGYVTIDDKPFPEPLLELIRSFNGPYGPALRKTYLIRHGLD
jgi:hypothetical protein